jgi:mRNA interferase RelE/StbE
MAKYRIAFKKSVAKDLRGIPKNDIKKILSRIDTLAENPRGEGCIKLSGKENYRIRQGLYRIVYEIKDDVLVVSVVKVAHRSQAYKSN